mgnify:CR=1 FL=1
MTTPALDDMIVVFAVLLAAYVLKTLKEMKDDIKKMEAEIQDNLERISCDVDMLNVNVGEFRDEWKIETNPYAKQKLKAIGYYSNDASYDDKDYYWAINSTEKINI